MSPIKYVTRVQFRRHCSFRPYLVRLLRARSIAGNRFSKRLKKSCVSCGGVQSLPRKIPVIFLGMGWGPHIHPPEWEEFPRVGPARVVCFVALYFWSQDGRVGRAIHGFHENRKRSIARWVTGLYRQFWVGKIFDSSRLDWKILIGTKIVFPE